jgi:hypothetical protein
VELFVSEEPGDRLKSRLKFGRFALSQAACRSHSSRCFKLASLYRGLSLLKIGSDPQIDQLVRIAVESKRRSETDREPNRS